MNRPYTSSRWRALLASLAAASLAISCGGGGGGTGIAGGGIGGTGITNGTITGFGSVIVNGQKFAVEDGTTQITIDDGASQPQTKLQVGMIVTIEHTNFTDGRVRADKINYQSDAKGPATVNTAAATIQVAGQTVLVDDQTCVQTSDDRTQCLTGAAGLAALAANPSVEVCGHRDSDGRIRATRVRETGSGGSGGPVELRGQMSGLNASTFVLNGITVNFAAAQAAGKVSGTLANGATVKVKAAQAPVNNQLSASEVQVESSGGGSGGGGTVPTIEIENLITRFFSNTDFDVNTRNGPQKVTTTTSTVFQNGAATGLAKDVKVKVRGKINSSNVLVADLVALRPTIEIEAQVESVNVAQSSVQLLGNPGITVKTNALTFFKDGRTFAQIAQGTLLKISAQQSGSDIVATRVEFEDELDETVLRGPVSAKASPSLTILGITVSTGAATQFESELGGSVNNQTSFFNAVTPGQTVVKAKGTFSGPNTLFADEAEIELPD